MTDTTPVTYYHDGERVAAFPWWRFATVWASPVNYGNADKTRPTPADVYADIAALPTTPYDELGMVSER